MAEPISKKPDGPTTQSRERQIDTTMDQMDAKQMEGSPPAGNQIPELELVKRTGEGDNSDDLPDLTTNVEGNENGDDMVIIPMLSLDQPDASIIVSCNKINTQFICDDVNSKLKSNGKMVTFEQRLSTPIAPYSENGR